MVVSMEGARPWATASDMGQAPRLGSSKNNVTFISLRSQRTGRMMGPNVSVQPLAQRKRTKNPPLQMLEVIVRVYHMILNQ